MEPGPTRREPFICKCGEADFLFGENFAFCKACRRKVVRPKEGYADREGNPKGFVVIKCLHCEKLYSMSDEETEVPPCPECGVFDVEVIKRF